MFARRPRPTPSRACERTGPRTGRRVPQGTESAPIVPSGSVPQTSRAIEDAIAAVRDALDHATASGDVPGPTLADAATTLGCVARHAGLPFDALLSAVTDAVERRDGSSSPEQDAVLLYLWRLAGRTYQNTPSPRPADLGAVRVLSVPPFVERTVAREGHGHWHRVGHLTRPSHGAGGVSAERSSVRTSRASTVAAAAFASASARAASHWDIRSADAKAAHRASVAPSCARATTPCSARAVCAEKACAFRTARSAAVIAASSSRTERTASAVSTASSVGDGTDSRAWFGTTIGTTGIVV